MKKTIQLLMLLFSFYSNAQQQQKQLIDSLDVKTFGNSKSIRNVVIYMPNADKKDVPVKIIMDCPESIYKSSGITLAKLNNMLIKSYYSAMYSCKNKYTFVPKEIELVYYAKCDNWLVTTIYTAQNDYGVTKEGDKSTFFDLKDYSEISISNLPCITNK